LQDGIADWKILEDGLKVKVWPSANHPEVSHSIIDSLIAQSVGDSCLFAPRAAIDDCVSFVFDAWFCNVCAGAEFAKKPTADQWDEIGYERKLGAFTHTVGTQYATRQTAGPFKIVTRTDLVSGDLLAGINAGLQGMCVGETRELIVPPSLGYHKLEDEPVVVGVNRRTLMNQWSVFRVTMRGLVMKTKAQAKAYTTQKKDMSHTKSKSWHSDYCKAEPVENSMPDGMAPQISPVPTPSLIGRCRVPLKSRAACGFGGVNPDLTDRGKRQCIASGCCYADDDAGHFYPWCYAPFDNAGHLFSDAGHLAEYRELIGMRRGRAIDKEAPATVNRGQVEKGEAKKPIAGCAFC
jgi:hypothetical protein